MGSKPMSVASAVTKKKEEVVDAVAVVVEPNTLDAICPVVALHPDKSNDEFEKLLRVRETRRVVLSSTTHFLVRTYSRVQAADGSPVRQMWAHIAFEFNVADVHHVRAVVHKDPTKKTLMFNPETDTNVKVCLAGSRGVLVCFRESAEINLTAVEIIARNGWSAIEMSERVAAALFTS
jgi:hypothetical protein